MTQLQLERREAMDLAMISSGLFRPLEGFMGREDLQRVKKKGRLKNGFPFPIEVTLKAKVKPPKAGEELILTHDGRELGTLEVEEIFEVDGETFIGGRVKTLGKGPDIKREKGWEKASGMVVYHPYFRFVEYAAKSTLEVTDGTVIAVPKEGGGTVPKHSVRMKAAKALVDGYIPKNACHLQEIDYYGRNTLEELVIFAIILKNMGCSIAILITENKKGFMERCGSLIPEIGIDVIVMDMPFYCKRCRNMATEKTCPHHPSQRTPLDMERATTLIRRGSRLPEEYVRPEVAKALAEGFLFGGG